jgi:hypothetical protein
MDINEAKEMLGTEFTYVYPDGDTIRAYVKAFDPEIGLTCWTLESETKSGWKKEGRPEKSIDKDGTYCCVALNFKTGSFGVSGALAVLQGIKDTGEYMPQGGSLFGSTPTCSF